MRMDRLQPSFVEDVPETLYPGMLYVSIPYATVVHSCCCGCGEEVVTPLTPTDWRLTYDGENVSLAPSVGSWTLPCRSHYVVQRGKVHWANAWSEEQISRERARDRKAKARYYDNARVAPRVGVAAHPPATVASPPVDAVNPTGSLSSLIVRLFRRFLG